MATYISANKDELKSRVFICLDCGALVILDEDDVNRDKHDAFHKKN